MNHIDSLKNTKSIFSLRAASLFIAVNKCIFLIEIMLFLRYIMSKDSISVDQSKVDVIWDGPQLTTLDTIRSFLKFAFFLTKSRY